MMTRTAPRPGSACPVPPRRGLGVAFATLVVLGAQSALPAQTETQRLSASDPVAGARFGDALTMSGTTLVVGAPGASEVHVFEHARGAGFGAIQVIVPPSGTTGARFGASVSLNGDLLAVGAPEAESVWVLERQADGTFGGMVQVQALAPQAGAKFGATVALRGDRLVVGAPFQDGKAGAAHVFQRQADGSFVHLAMLRPAGVYAGDEFGTCVTFDDDGSTFFVSAVQDDDATADAGAVYVIEDQSGMFTVTDKLVAPSALALDRAGRALSCTGDTLAVGVRGDDQGGREIGSVHLWTRTGFGFAWAGKLFAPDRMEGDMFGHSVVLCGDKALIGAIARDGNGFVRDAGRAYLFQRDASGAFSFVEAFDPPVAELSGWYGYAVGLCARGLAIGRSNGVGGAGEVVAMFEPPSVDPSTSTVAVDPSTIELGQEATVTVVPRDDLGEVFGPGLSVTISTTLGQMLGAVVDEGDGRYTQRVLGDVDGTAEISAMVDGQALLATASLSVRDPSPQVRIAGERRDGTLVPFESIQAAVDAAGAQGLSRILVAPGVYEEVVHIERCRHLALVGLASYGPVTVRGLRITRSFDVEVEGLHIQETRRGDGGVRIGYGARQVTLRGVFVEGTRRHAGILIGPITRDVVLQECRVDGAARDGIAVIGFVWGLTIQDCVVIGSGRNGIELGRYVREVLVMGSELRDNGRSSRHRDGYGIVRDGGRGRRVRPEDVTLIGNDVRGNCGRSWYGRSTPDFGNYRLMIDATDDQAPFNQW